MRGKIYQYQGIKLSQRTKTCYTLCDMVRKND